MNNWFLIVKSLQSLAFPQELLAQYLNVPAESLASEEAFLPALQQQGRPLQSKLLLLWATYNEEPSLHTQSTLELLMQAYHFSAETLAKMAKLTPEKVEQFLEDPACLSAEEQYRLSDLVWQLRYLFKEQEGNLYF